jgi:hypothetical protein
MWSTIGAIIVGLVPILAVAAAWLSDRYGRAAQARKEKEAKINAIGENSTAADVTHTFDGL